MATSWSVYPRNLVLGVYCFSNSGGTNLGAKETIVNTLKAAVLLEDQAAGALGEKLWVNDIKPAL